MCNGRRVTQKTDGAYQEYIERFRDKGYAEDYHQSSTPRMIGGFTGRRRFLGWLVRKFEVKAVRTLLPSCKGNSVLDAPCGSGKLIPDLLKMKLMVIGIDSSQEMLSKIHGEHFMNLSLIKADIRKMPLADGSADIVICHRLLHRISPAFHLDTLREVHRVSKEYAILYFSTTNVLTNIIAWLERHLNFGDRGKIFYMSQKAIKEELTSCGWHFVRTKPVMPLGISAGYLVAVKKKSMTESRLNGS